MAITFVSEEINTCNKMRGKANLLYYVVYCEMDGDKHKEFYFLDERKAKSKIEQLKNVIQFNKKRIKKLSNYTNWTESSVECYERNGVCYGCKYAKLESGCKMNKTVEYLQKRFGTPHIDNELSNILEW